MKKDLSGNVTKVLAVYLVFIIALISYIAYFQIFKADSIAEKEANPRIWAERNEILRGTIFDKDMNPLTKSTRVNTLKQDREYIYGELYANILGYVNPDFGLSGMESSYDKELRSYNKLSFSNIIKSLNFMDAFNNRGKDDEKVGNSIVTTLDTELQKAAFNALGDKKGSIVVLNPKTGDILAMVSKPTYNSNDLENVMKKANAGELPKDSLINKATSGLYAPGSTFKVVTLSSALKNINGIENRTFSDDGRLEVGPSYSLSNQHGTAYGSINLKKALSVSSNVVFGGLALELGNDKLKKVAEDFGFNSDIETQGFNLRQSKFPELKNFEKGDIAQSGIGQGQVVATPMQMALIAGTIANNGVMMQPKLASKVLDKESKLVKTLDPKPLKTVLDSNTVTTVKEYMNYLISERVPRDGAWQKAFGGLNAAGKTGTADYKLENGQDAIPNAWFIGFAPANDPKVAVAVLVENGKSGGGIAAETAGIVMRAALKK